MSTLKPDPQLKAAMKEIESTLRKYDCAAIVFLSSADSMEYLYDFSPSWSCAKLGDNGELRIKSLRSMYPSKDAHKKAVAETTGLFFGFADLISKAGRDVATIVAMLGKHFDISHWSKEL